MACKTESKVIGGNTYSATQWSATESLLMKMRLVKLFGPAIAALAPSENKDDMKSLSDGLTNMFVSNDPKEVVAVLKECIIGVALDDTRITASSFEEHFSGDNLLKVYQVFIFVLQVNYGNFLKGRWAENLMSKIKEKL